jgi:hypothetical protein
MGHVIGVTARTLYPLVSLGDPPLPFWEGGENFATKRGFDARTFQPVTNSYTG